MGGENKMLDNKVKDLESWATLESQKCVLRRKKKFKPVVHQIDMIGFILG